jgi:hypothetical protein
VLVNLTLWIVAGLLAALALFSGGTKVFLPKSKLDASTDWTGSASAGFVRTTGGWPRSQVVAVSNRGAVPLKS